MARKTKQITEAEFDEIKAALDYSRSRGGDGFGGFYVDLLDYYYERRMLPPSRVPRSALPEDERR